MSLEPAALARVACFAELSAPTLQMVADVTQSRRYEAGAEIVAHQGTDNDFYIILAGTVRVSIVANTGRALTYQVLPQGEVFGEVAAIDQGQRTAGVHAETEAVIGHIEAREFTTLLSSSNEFALVILNRLARLNRRLIERIFEYHAYDVRGRVYAEILREMDADGSYAITDRDMASRVGTTRENVSRIIRKLHTQGILHRYRQATKVLQRDALIDLLSESEFS